MLTDQGCPQTPGGRIRALGFARWGARGRRRGPIPAVCHRYSSPVSHSGGRLCLSDAGARIPDQPYRRGLGRAGRHAAGLGRGSRRSFVRGGSARRGAI